MCKTVSKNRVTNIQMHRT